MSEIMTVEGTPPVVRDAEGGEEWAAHLADEVGAAESPSASEAVASAEEMVSVLPPRMRVGGILAETPLPPEEEAPAAPPPAEAPLTAEEAKVLERIGRRRPRELANQISTLYDEVAEKISSKEDLTNQALKLLSEARDLLLEQPRQFDQAEYRIGQVQALLIRVENSRKWAATYGYRLLAYELVFFCIFAGAWLYTWLGIGSATSAMNQVFPLWSTLMWGGIGGVVGALYSLHWHAAEKQDFDRQYNMWYVVQPWMGVILGGIIYLIIRTGFLALQAAEPGAEAAEAVQWFPSLVACLAGFRQKFAYELLDQIIQAIGRRPAS